LLTLLRPPVQSKTSTSPNLQKWAGKGCQDKFIGKGTPRYVDEPCRVRPAHGRKNESRAEKNGLFTNQGFFDKTRTKGGGGWGGLKRIESRKRALEPDPGHRHGLPESMTWIQTTTNLKRVFNYHSVQKREKGLGMTEQRTSTKTPRSRVVTAGTTGKKTREKQIKNIKKREKKKNEKSLGRR